MALMAWSAIRREPRCVGCTPSSEYSVYGMDSVSPLNIWSYATNSSAYFNATLLITVSSCPNNFLILSLSGAGKRNGSRKITTIPCFFSFLISSFRLFSIAFKSSSLSIVKPWTVSLILS